MTDDAFYYNYASYIHIVSKILVNINNCYYYYYIINNYFIL